MAYRVGSLFSGVAGLDLGVCAGLGLDPYTDVAWHVENDPAASLVLKHRFPRVPNHGDITAVDWVTVEPVDILIGGSPCQDLSHAGKRGGMREGTRSNLWVAMRDAIAALQPRLVVWENVRGALSAEADSDVEPCPGCVGDGTRQPALRALGRLLGDLTDLGYDCRWVTVPASAVGACHRRERVFVVAGHTEDIIHERGWPLRGIGPGDSGASGSSGGPPTENTDSAVSGERWPAGSSEAESWGARPDTGRRSVIVVAYPKGDGRYARWPKPAGQLGGSDAPECSPSTAPDADDTRLEGTEPEERHDLPPWGGGIDWGTYGPAVRRWETVLGRPAPNPVTVGVRGGRQLSGRFTEWMMGFPEGWITDIPGVSNNDALALCGNAVIPAQCAYALTLLLP